MLYSDRDILSAILDQDVRIEPFEPSMIQPSSIDVRLAHSFRVIARYPHTHIDPALDQPNITQLVTVATDEPFILHPGEFVLASTLEKITLPAHIAARLEGKSSLGRLGIMVHTTAGFIDPGFTGAVTLELTNASGLPVKLWPGMKIGQLCLLSMTSAAQFPYGHPDNGSKYQGQTGPTASRAHLDFGTA